ncbi:unnamed protein product [Brachionus calyciflorus]|uniref:Uncharacterized protein n=1 Tax=Brachionus calyciflorus TaxID=104777 RepID=A0A814DAR4_9BILA|nr:unnamed protein product [Brachionus calyciflorus]
MPTDIWFLLNSYVDDRLNIECNEIIVSTNKIKNNNLNTTSNSNDLESLNVDVNADLKQIVLNMHKEISDLKESNSKILEVVTTLKGKNDRLKKFFENCTKFKNFNLFSNDDDQIIEDSNTNLDDVFEPQFTSSLTAAPKPVKPAKIFDYYTGFWSLQSDELSVNEFISKRDSSKRNRSDKSDSDSDNDLSSTKRHHQIDHSFSQNGNTTALIADQPMEHEIN